MIYFKASIRAATAASDDAITTGSVGISVALDLAPAFAGLAKTLVFTDGTVSVDVALVGDAVSATVPHEVLTTPMRRLALGIWAADGDGNVVIPTVWADAGVIYKGAAPSGVDPAAPTPSWVAQVQTMASDALEKAEAVETAAEQGRFDGADGYSPTVSVTEIPGGHRVTITDIDGAHVFDVMDGQGGGGGSDDVMWAVYGTTTNAEISAAHAAGQIVVCEYNGDIYRLVYQEEYYALLTSMIHANEMILECSSDSWSNDAVTFGTYSKPSGGIPKTDLAYAVQASLGKADTALQSAPVTKVNNKTGDVSLGASDVGALPAAGGTMSGAIAMGANKITGLGNGTADTDAVNKKQVADAIAALGEVLDFKGAVQDVADLPSTGNTGGDVYFVRSLGAMFVWVETGVGGAYEWDEMGEHYDMSGYIEAPQSPSANQFLKWNGSAWVASATGDIPAPASPSSGDFLVYNGSAWVAQSLSTWQGGSY